MSDVDIERLRAADVEHEGEVFVSNLELEIERLRAENGRLEADGMKQYEAAIGIMKDLEHCQDDERQAEAEISRLEGRVTAWQRAAEAADDDHAICHRDEYQPCQDTAGKLLEAARKLDNEQP